MLVLTTPPAAPTATAMTVLLWWLRPGLAEILQPEISIAKELYRLEPAGFHDAVSAKRHLIAASHRDAAIAGGYLPQS